MFENKMGIRASATRELVMRDCRIPKSRMVGRRGTGFITVMKTLDLSRPGIASLGVGLAQAALDEAVSYAKQRVQFERPIIAFQAVQHMLADMAIQTEAARSLVYAAARHIDQHPKDMSKVSSMCKVFATDTAMKVLQRYLQRFQRERSQRELIRDRSEEFCGRTSRKIAHDTIVREEPELACRKEHRQEEVA